MFDSSVVDCKCNAYEVVVVFIMGAAGRGGGGGGGEGGGRLEWKIAAFKEFDRMDVLTD